MATTYELYQNGNFGSLTKTVTAGTLDNQVIVKIEVAHIKKQGYKPLVQVIVHKWNGGKDSHAFLEFPTVKDGWKAFTQLCEVLGVTV